MQLALDLGDAPGDGRAQRAAGDDRRPSGCGPSSRCSGSTRAGTSSTSTSRSSPRSASTRAPDLLRCRSQAEVLVAGVKVATQTPPIRSGRRVVFVTLDDATRPGRRDVLRGRPGPLRRDAVPLLAAGHPRRGPPHRAARGVDAGHRLLGAARAARRLAGRRPGRGRRGDGRHRAGHRAGSVAGAAESRSTRPVMTRPPLGGSARGLRAARGREGRVGRRHGRGRAGCWCTRAGSASRRTPTSSRPASPATTPGRRPARRRRRRRASCGTPARGARADEASLRPGADLPVPTRDRPAPAPPAPPWCGRSLREVLAGGSAAARRARRRAAAPAASPCRWPSSGTGSPWSTPAPTRWPRWSAGPARPVSRSAPCRATRPACSTSSSPAAPTWCSATACSSSSTTRPRPLAALAAVLRPGGRLSLLVANRNAVVLARALAGRLRRGRGTPSTTRTAGGVPATRCRRRFTEPGLAALLGDAGLRVEAGARRAHRRRPGARRPASTPSRARPTRCSRWSRDRRRCRSSAPWPPSCTSRCRQGPRPRPNGPIALGSGAMSRSQQLDRPGPPTGPPGDDAGCTVLHVDMDAFYASASSCCSRPELRGKPGHRRRRRRRGVVLSATYEARALRRPQRDADDPGPPAVPAGRRRRARPRRATREVSAGVMEIFRSVTPLVEPLSLDEAFLDVAGAVRRLGAAARRSAELIRDRVADEQGITCSVGVATTKFVAKLASARVQAGRPARRARATGWSASCTRCRSARCGAWGRRPRRCCTRLGLRTVGDIAHTPLRHPAAGARARPPARTCTRWPGAGTSAGSSPHEPDKSIGAEETFARDVDDPDGRPPRAAAAVRADGRPAARRRPGRPHRRDQDPVRRLHHHHPGPHPARAHRRRRASSTTPPASSTRRSAWTGPGSGWSASGSRAWSSPSSRRTSCSSASGPRAGARPSRRPTGPPDGSATGPCDRPAWSIRTGPQGHANERVSRPGFIGPLGRISFPLTAEEAVSSSE